MPFNRQSTIDNRQSPNSQSKAAFISKISIVIEEADESEFWLEFIVGEKLMKKEKVQPLLSEAHELASIFITLVQDKKFFVLY